MWKCVNDEEGPKRSETKLSDHPRERVMGQKETRLAFFRAMFRLLQVVWPILSGVLMVMIACGVLAGRIEGWSLTDALYFTFVTGLTIGYGDFTPHFFSSRVLTVVIGFSGIVFTGLVAAVSVQALRGAGIGPNS